MSRDGVPLCTYTLAGNVSDFEALQSVIATVRRRWDLKEVVVVADSGMTSKKNIDDLKASGIHYILGSRMRSVKAIKEQVLNQLGDWETVKENLKVQEKTVNGKRYIICYNPQEAKREKATREKLIRKLEDLLQASSSPKQFIRHRLYKRFLKIPKGSSKAERLGLDREAIEADERYDGIFVIESNTTLEGLEIALRYKDLILVEQAFRFLKSTVQVRPVFHQTSRNIKGHIFVSYLALYFFCLLLRSLEQSNTFLPCEQHEIISTLSRLQAHHVSSYGFHYWLRSEPLDAVKQLFSMLKIKMPPRTLEVLNTPDQPAYVVPS